MPLLVLAGPCATLARADRLPTCVDGWVRRLKRPGLRDDSPLWNPPPRLTQKRFDTVTLIDEYVGENLARGRRPTVAVRYFDEVERAKYRVTVSEGRLVDANGNALTDADLIWVMDEAGNFYMYRQLVDRVQHSSALAGGPIAAGGTVRLKDGVITMIDNLSGHYRPRRERLFTAVEELRRQGANITESVVIPRYERTGR